MNEMITSLSNPRIKQVRALRERKARHESGLFVVEGIHHIGEAAAACQHGGPRIAALFYAPELLDNAFARRLVDDQAALGTPCLATSAVVFQSMADKENPQGLLAVLRQPDWRLPTLSPVNFPWGVALVSPQDPGNVGSILRTVDAVGASGVILLDSSVDPYHPGAVRASMGTLFWHPVARASFDEFITWARACGYVLYGTSAHAPCHYRQVIRYQQPCILVLGSEREGLSQQQAAACDQLLSLPMLGRAGSLNLAVAAGVLLYAMLESC
jgi:TrmH family RNA methyltransferase